MTSDLHECITLGRVALELHQPGDPGQATYLCHLVPDLQTILRKLERTLDIQSSVDTASLHKLIVLFYSEFMVN